MRAPGQGLLGAVAFLVPESSRRDWLTEWTAELEAAWEASPQRFADRVRLYARAAGSLEDALWLRIRTRRTWAMGRDVRYALQGVGKDPAFSAVILVTLALGIGANSAVFALVDAVLLRPMPVNNPEELVDVYTSCRRGYAYCSSSYPDFLDYRARNHTLSDLAAYAGTMVSVSGDGQPRMAEAMFVTGNYFGLLGVGAELGRVFTPADNILTQPVQHVVLSHRAWRNRFGEQEDVVGQTVTLNGAGFTVIGVAPEGFTGTRLNLNPEMWLPMATAGVLDSPATGSGVSRLTVVSGSERLTNRSFRWMDALVGRRNADVAVEAVGRDMDAVSDQLERESEPLASGGTRRSGRRITVAPTRSVTLPASSGADITRFLWLLMSVVAAALLIACANIANLLLSRATARKHEMGVRLALGAGRGQLIRQLLTESATFAVFGSVLGVFVARGILAALSQFSLPGFISIASLSVTLDARVAAFTTILASLTAIGFGLIPALQSTRADITDQIKGGRSGASLSGMRTRNTLLAFQSGLALVLVLGAGLFIKSLKNGLDTDVGYRTENLAIAAADPGSSGYDETRTGQLLRDWAERSRAATGATSVTTALLEPMSRSSSGYFATFEGYEPGPDEEVRIEANFVGADYFRTLGINLTAGRDFAPGDDANAPMVGVVNRTIVDRYFAGHNPVGSTFSLGWGYDIEIVGYVRDVNHALREDQGPFIYMPIQQHLDRAVRRDVYVLAEIPFAASSALPAIRQVLNSIDPRLPVSELTTLSNRKAEYLMPQRMGTTLLSALGILTLLLTVLGIAGVVGFVIGRQKKEIGVRLALGAQRRRVVSTIATGVLKPIGAGLAVGLLSSIGLSRLLETFLYDMKPTDPTTYAAVLLLIGVAAGAAAFLPAHRASAVDPTEALRCE